jgi:hypothetical protein
MTSVVACWKCKTDIVLPASLHDAAKRSSNISFFCPYGHEGVFREGETEADVLRRERDRALQQLAQKDDEIAQARKGWNEIAKELKATKATAVKARKRTAAGLCPCCNRSFRQMALHLKTKHPTFRAEEVA